MIDRKGFAPILRYEGEQHQLARDMVDHLPGVWSYSDEESRAYYAVLRDRGGSGVRVRLNNGRIRVTGMWPDPIHGTHHTHQFEPDRHGGTCPAITCDPKRGAEAIAKDVARRFLPKYTTMWLKMLDKRAEQIAEDELESAAIQRLIVAGASREHGGGQRNRVYFRYTGDTPHGHADVSVHGEQVCVSLDIGGIPLEVAEAVIAELADCRNAIRLAKIEAPKAAEKEDQPIAGLDGREVPA